MVKNQLFDGINTSNMQKNRAFMLPYSHNYPILVRSTGIEVCDDMQKALIFKAFLLLNANVDAKFLIFFGDGDKFYKQ